MLRNILQFLLALEIIVGVPRLALCENEDETETQQGEDDRRAPPRVYEPLDDAGEVNLGLGVQWYNQNNQNFYFPVADIQISVSSHVALGLMVNFYSVGAADFSFSTYEGLIGFHFYGEEPYGGLWLQLAGGLFMNKTEVSGNTSHISAKTLLSTLGWRWCWEGGATNLGLGVGVQAFFGTKTAVLPTIMLGIGIPL
jgi:hypothetical protein